VNETRIISARHVVTIASDPIQGGAIAIRNDRIIDVGPQKSLIDIYPKVPILNLSEHILMPALVNAHTHIALTNAANFVSDKEFLDWLLALMPWMMKQSRKDFFKSSLNGLNEMIKSGITAIGDSFFILEPLRAALKHDFRCVFFFEVFGISAFLQNIAILKYKNALKSGLKLQSTKTRLGISPHAPYTVTPQVLKFASKFSTINKMRISMHISETEDEIEFLHSLKGRFRQQFEPSGKKIPITNLSLLEYIDSFGLVNDRFLAIHGVHLTDNEFALLAKRKGHLVSCPSSNKNLKTGWLDIERPFKAGVNTCIGTDSPASSDGIDLFNELRLALKTGTPDEINISARDALFMITINPSRALGFEKEIGTIEVGKSADILALKPPDGIDKWHGDIENLIIRKSKADDVDLTISSGIVKHSRIDTIPPHQ